MTSSDFLLDRWRIKSRKLKTLLPEEERTGWFECELERDENQVGRAFASSVRATRMAAGRTVGARWPRAKGTSTSFQPD